MKKVMLALIAFLTGGASGFYASREMNKKLITKKDEKIEKFKSYYEMLNEWFYLKQRGKTIVEYFEKKGIKKIAIYGMGEMGNRLYDELDGTSVEVAYAIDRNTSSSYRNLKMCNLEEQLETVDAVVVTAVFAFDEIEKELSQKVDFTIVSLKDVIFEI